MYKSDGGQKRQKVLLNILVNVYELVGFIELTDGSLCVYTKEVIWKNYEPYYAENYEASMGVFINSYVPAGNRDEVTKKFSIEYLKAKLDNSEERYEFIYPYMKDGEIRYKQITVLWGDEKRESICMVRKDVTTSLMAEWETKKQLENALALAKEANEAKREFLSAMSHDIRTPMNAIIGMTELALANRDNPKQIDESLSTIKISSEHLLNLINKILDMSRIESGQLVLMRKYFSHKEEVAKLVARSQALAEVRKVQFSYTFQVCHDDCIGDVLRIHQILDNLIGNAIKFTPKGGKVSLDVKELLPAKGQIGIYQYTITDSGVGISDEDMKQMFEPFYRSDVAKKKKVEGTGLGLSIAKNLIDYMGGAIHVKSRVNEGTCFTVEIPVRLAETVEANAGKDEQKDRKEEQDLEGMRILLVEDHPVNQLVATKMLENMNAVVTVAENGYVGKERFISSQPGEFDVICMDIQMPVMNGYESTEAIRSSSHPQAKTIPIVAMTANAFLSDVSRCLERGMNAHIAKPIESAKLYHVLKNVREEKEKREEENESEE